MIKPESGYAAFCDGMSSKFIRFDANRGKAKKDHPEHYGNTIEKLPAFFDESTTTSKAGGLNLSAALWQTKAKARLPETLSLERRTGQCFRR
jgi:hypothetical protein